MIKLYAEEITKNLDGIIEFDEVLSLIEKPRYEGQGDLAFPCFMLAKKLRKSPNIIASELSSKIQNSSFEKVVAEGAYVNCFLNRKYVSSKILNKIIHEREYYGTHDFGKEEKIVIDFSSPNIAKPFSMGHLRSTVIGNSIANISEKCGYESIKINHLGDWGTQFGKLIVAYKRWGDESKVKQNPIKELLELYVKFHLEAENDPFLNDEGRLWFNNLENGDKEASKLWKWFSEESLKEFTKIYDLLDINFDSFQGEAFYNDKMNGTIKLLEENGLLQESDGAEVVSLAEYDLPPCLIKKSDGATLYATRDITAAIYRYQKYKFERAFYVVGDEQSLHFKQVITVLEKMGYKWANQIVHVPFGFILKDGKKMSTRKGKIVLLEEVIKEAILLSERNITEKNPTLQNKKDVAERVGVGAIIFHDLKNYRQNNVEFSLDEMLKFEGATGPYVQYTHARACSILRKAKENNIDLDFSGVNGLDDDYSWSVVKQFVEFPNIVKRSFYEYDPSLIAKYLIELAQEFNKCYGNVRFLVNDSDIKNRIAFVKTTTIVLKEGLRLLGISSPEKM